MIICIKRIGVLVDKVRDFLLPHRYCIFTAILTRVANFYFAGYSADGDPKRYHVTL